MVYFKRSEYTIFVLVSSKFCSTSAGILSSAYGHYKHFTAALRAVESLGAADDELGYLPQLTVGPRSLYVEVSAATHSPHTSLNCKTQHLLS